MADSDVVAGVDSGGEDLAVVRRGEREGLLAGRLVDAVDGIAAAQRFGPFPDPAGDRVWFDVLRAARRVEVRETGVALPAFVITGAGEPVVDRGTVVEVADGTVWVRGDLLGGGLPAGAFVGIAATGGALRIRQATTIGGTPAVTVVRTAHPIDAVLDVQPAPGEVAADPDGCGSSGASVRLPASLRLGFTAGTSTAKGDGGSCEVWGQGFDVGPCAGTWRFAAGQWTAVLGYEVERGRLDGDAVATDLLHLSGTGKVAEAGLGFPVVVPPSVAVLAEAGRMPAWFLVVEGLAARWYDGEPHPLPPTWIGVFASGVTLVAEGVAPLAQPVAHEYGLWRIAGSGHRLPWRQTYDLPFALWYRCHVVEGEALLAQGHAEVVPDRPVTTDGLPVPLPPGPGTVLLRRLGGQSTAWLGASLAADPEPIQFALRNALVWTTAPTAVVVGGDLTGTVVDAGTAQLALGALGWAPTLPDPYVATAALRRPRRFGAAAPLRVDVAWTDPDTVEVSFEGSLGPSLALAAKEASPLVPRPAGRSEGADLGLTQVEQGRLGLDRKGEALFEQARARERELRGGRVESAHQQDAVSRDLVTRHLSETFGPAPDVLLLDVSTNQDLLGVAVGARRGAPGGFSVSGLAVRTEVTGMRVVTLPQVQWEPVRTLDDDQDVMTMGWFPTPLAAASDGGATHIGTRSQKLAPVIPEDALQGTFDAYRDGTPVGIRTTFPFGLIAAVRLIPRGTLDREADRYHPTRPEFPAERSVGGLHVTARAEGGRPDDGGVSPAFDGVMRQLLNGVDLASGSPLGLSVLGETLQPAGSVETVFNNDMSANPKVPVTRIDLSGYGGSSFSDWNNPFAAFAEAAKVRFRVVVGRTALEVIKVNSVLHPWGVRVTRSVTIERRSGGGVIRRDSGWQAFTPGLFDYRYFDTAVDDIVVAPYTFDAGIFRGLFDARAIRPAPGPVFSHGSATLVPYHFDADVALEGVPTRGAAIGVLGYLQTTPNGHPAGVDALRALLEAQGPIGGPIDMATDFGGSGLPFRAQRVEVGLALDGPDPVFVATVRGAPVLPTTGAWSVVVRPVASVPPGGGEAVPVAENRGVPLIRRYPVKYAAGDRTTHTEPPLAGAAGVHRFADAADLLTPTTPANDYALLQATPTHALLFPRPSVPTGTRRVESGTRPALADILARSTSKGAFPPPANTIELGALDLTVSPTGALALPGPVDVVGHPTALRLAGVPGHGTNLRYDSATLHVELHDDHWSADFTGLRVWSDVAGLEEVTGTEMHIAGGTDRRPQVVRVRSLILAEIEEILRYIPLFGDRGTQGPFDLAATNAKREVKVEVKTKLTIPSRTVIASFPAGTGVILTLYIDAKSGIDPATGGAKAAAVFGVSLEGKVPLLTGGLAAVFLIVAGEVTFSITSVSGTVVAEKFELMAFVGIGVEGRLGPFKAYAFLGIGFVMEYDALTKVTKYGGLVAIEAGISVAIVSIKVRAELKGLVYQQAGKTLCDYSGSVKVEVDLFLIISISASYQVTETAQLS